MKLISLELNNFKSVKHFKLEANGEDKNIYGKNGVGKTTLADAYYWLLVDKSSNDKKLDEDIKLKDSATGNPVLDHGIEHSVEGIFELDTGCRVALKKVYKEKWVKQNGNPNKEFAGHVTDYFVDDVARSKKDYTSYITDNIADINLFKMVSSTLFFNSMLWKKQREILLDICGDVSDADVIKFCEKLNTLPEILQGKSVNDFIEISQQRKSKINKELDTIPIRIDEAVKALDEFSNLPSKEVLENELNSLQEQQKKINGQIIAIQNGSEIQSLKNQIEKVDIELEKLRNKCNLESQAKNQKAKLEVDELTALKNSNTKRIEEYELTIKSNEETINKYDVEIADQRHKYMAEYDSVFDEKEAVCPTCGQVLPQEKIDEAIKNFKSNRAKNLKAIVEYGTSLANNKEKLIQENNKLKQELPKLEEENIQLMAKIKALSAGDKANTADENYERLNNSAYQNLRTQKTLLLKDLNDIQTVNISKISTLRTTVQQLDLDIKNRMEKLAQHKQVDKFKQRIDKLKDKHKQLGKEFENICFSLNLAQLFIKNKVSMLTNKINNKFSLARFKLFDTQINGGVNECCEAMTLQGSTYSKSMSNGEKVKISLDICNTLSKHYNINVPIFIDNAESITELQKLDVQKIMLVVSHHDELTIKDPIIKD